MDAVIECILYAIVVVTRTAGNEIPMYGEALLEEQQQQEEQPEEEEEEEKKVDQRYKHDEEEKKVEQRHKHDEEEKKVEQRHKHGEETWGKEREETMPACIREVTDVQRGIMGVQKGDWILLTGISPDFGVVGAVSDNVGWGDSRSIRICRQLRTLRADRCRLQRQMRSDINGGGR